MNPASRSAKFIYISGCDGTGKSRQADLLLSYLHSAGARSRIVWLRFPFFFSLPLLAYARLRGYSRSETHAGVKFGYWEFHRSPFLSSLFPWAYLVDALVFATWKIYLPLLCGSTVICERFVLDMLVDLSVACHSDNLHLGLPGKWYLKLIPKPSRVFILDLDGPTIRSRRENLQFDRDLEARLKIYRQLAKSLDIPVLSSLPPVETVHARILKSIWLPYESPR
jgi:thymidylate kinase